MLQPSTKPSAGLLNRGNGSGHHWNTFLSYAQIAGFAITIASLPLNNMFMSIGTIWIGSACLLQWITDIVSKKPIHQRLHRFTKNRSALLLTSLYLLVVIGMFWTEDLKHGKWDLRMKLPILILPFVMLTLQPLTAYWIRVLKGIFLLSLSFAVMWCLLIYWRINPREWTDVRQISVFISNVRFSLLLVLGIVITFHEVWNRGAIGKMFCFIITLFFCYFLFVVESVTGFMVLGAVVLWWLMFQVIRQSRKSFRIAAIVALFLLPLLGTLYFNQCYRRYFTVEEINWDALPPTTSLGDMYDHNTHYPLVEEGHYSMTHIAWGELYSAWQMRSTLHPDSADAKGHAIKGTLIRYAASKGLNKDHDGIMQLTDEDVRNIEHGVTSVNELKKNPLHKRIDNILFEYSNFRAGGSANGHSVFQRIEFWRASVGIIKKNVWTGVGTGDTKQAFAEQYTVMNSRLDVQHRLRAHNQYLTMWLTYGVLGFLLFVLMIVSPLLNSGWRNTLHTSFIVIAALSFLTEDTLESQAGVMFFAFFYVFLLLPKVKETSPLHSLRYSKKRPSKDVH